MQKTLLLFFLLFSVKILSQEYLFGKVTTEQNIDLAEVLVINTRTEEQTTTNHDGNFMISARIGDELRFVKPRFQRTERKINSENFKKSTTIILEKSEVIIPEVVLGFKPTGDIKKDNKALNKSQKTVALNREMGSYMKKPLHEVSPQLRTPSAFEKPTVNAAQIDIVKLVSFVAGLIKGKSMPEFIPSAKQKEAFIITLRKDLTDEYFLSMNLKLEEVDAFLKFADQKLQLTKNFKDNYNLSKIKLELEKAIKGYQPGKS